MYEKAQIETQLFELTWQSYMLHFHWQQSQRDKFIENL